MLSGIETLAIKPLKVYQDNRRHKTSLEGFQDMLERTAAETEAVGGQAASAVTTEASKETPRTDETADAAEKTDSIQGAEDAVIFTNPVTGRKVIYIDVAASDKAGKSSSAKPASDTAASSKVNSKDVTTAASMKKTRYDAIFKRAAKKYNISESLLKGIAMAESNFDPNCTSGSGAMGVMQLMPATARELGVTDPYDPEQNIMGGAKCIAAKLKEFNGDVRLALAAYNAGSGTVRKYGGVPSQCKVYVQRVLSFKKGFETAKAVG